MGQNKPNEDDFFDEIDINKLSDGILDETEEEKAAREAAEAEAARKKAEEEAAAKGNPNETEEEKAARLKKEEEEASKSKDNEAEAIKLKEKYKDQKPDDIKKSLASDVAASFGGKGFDEEGNVIDADGKILKKYEEFEAEYNRQLALINPQPKANPIDNFIQLTGFAPVDAQGNAIEYQTNKEGLKQYLDDYKNAGINDFKQQLFGAYPVLIDVFNHVRAGNDMSTYSAQKDYSSIEFKQTDTQVHEEIIKENLRQRGNKENQLDLMTKAIIDSSNSFEAAKEAKQEIAERKQQKEQALIEANEARQKQQIEEERKYWNDVKNVINSELKTSSVGNITIPQADKAGFFDYISKGQGQQGYTQAQIDSNNMSLEDTLFLQYLMYKKFKPIEIIGELTNKQKVNSLKEMIAKTTVSSGANQTSTEELDLTDLSIDDFFGNN